MKLKDFYHQVVRIGIENDPRGKEEVLKLLEEKKKEYEELSEREKKYFDTEQLNNPYSDTRILWGNEDVEIKTILVGIDIEGSEILLADRLNAGKKKIDLVLAHHPEGSALANLTQVMSIQSDLLYSVGVPPSVAESLLAERIKEVERRLLPVNHMRNVDIARALDIPFMCAHTVADNCVTRFLTRVFEEKKPNKLKDILDILLEFPEYQFAAKHNSGPRILIGDKNNKAGKIYVDMTGGTEGSKDIFEKMTAAGISTLVCMHLSEEHYKKAQSAHINVIIAGHIASDSLGLNLVLDEVEKKEKFEFIECSGFRRYRR